MQPWNWQNPIGAKPMARAELDALSKPQSAGQQEVVTHVLWDVQSIASGAAGPFNFFSTLQVDPTLGNMPLAGQLADPMYFIPQWMYVDYLVLPNVAATAASLHPVDDVAELQVNQRASFQISNGPKNYPVQGNYPLRACGPIGGLIPYVTLEGAAAGGAGMAYVNGGIPGSQGFFIGGSWALGPSQKFNVKVTVAAAPTLSATIKVMISFTGTLYQAVA